ncbi:MAG: hypothetical protein L7F78_19275 [Syntrophales bacterium LBB04]|nr:hypothetical protein [Syntrophales bacterium LBB04]
MPESKTTDITKMAAEMINFMKNAFSTNIQAMIMLQDQSVRILNPLVEQGLVAQKEAHKILHEWTDNSKKAVTDFQKITEENFDRLAQYLK